METSRKRHTGRAGGDFRRIVDAQMDTQPVGLAVKRNDAALAAGPERLGSAERPEASAYGSAE